MPTCQDFTEASARTSDLPEAPKELVLLARRPNEVLLECSVVDPEGAPITALEVERHGVTWHSVAMGEAMVDSWDWDELGGGPGRSVTLTVGGLAGENELRLWAKSIVGRRGEEALA